MSTYQAPGEISLESLQDAPEGDWLPAILENYNQTQRQLSSAFKQGLTTRENTTSGEKELNLTHATEVPCANPLSVPIRGIYVVSCEGLELDSLGKPTGQVYPLDSPVVSWRLNPNSDSGGVILKAVFPAPVGACRTKSTVNVSIPYAAPTAITWESATQNGNLSWAIAAPTKIVCAVPGVVSLGYGMLFDTALGGYREAAALLNGSALIDYAYELTPGGTYAGLAGNDEVTVAAGDYLTLTAYQNQTAAAALNLLGALSIPHFSARYVAPPTNTVGRVNLFFYGG